MPASRPLKLRTASEVQGLLVESIRNADGFSGAHCIHEMWMRGEMAVNIELMLERLWNSCADSIPEWLPMRYIEWLPKVYDIATQFEAGAKGRSNIYLVLLDYRDRESLLITDPYGIYVGMSEYSAAERFDQHKAGIRAAGSVLKRGIEPLTGPTLHLQGLERAEAARIEVELAEALLGAGLRVQGGH